MSKGGYLKIFLPVLTGLFLASFVALNVFATGSSPSPSPSPSTCVSTGHENLTGSVSTSGNATVTNTSQTCSFQVGLASYKMFDLNIDNQVLFSSQTVTINPGQTLNLQVNVPDCAFQIDLFQGSLITSFAGGVRYGARLIDVKQVFNPPTFCQVVSSSPSPSPTPTVVPSPSPSPTAGGGNTQEQTQTQTQTNTQTINVTVTQPQVLGAKVPAKQPETGTGVLGLVTLGSMGPIGYLLTRYSKSKTIIKKEEDISSFANELWTNRQNSKN